MQSIPSNPTAGKLLKNQWLVLSLLLISLFFIFSAAGSFAQKNTSKTILVYSKTNGFRHESIADGIEAIRKMGAEKNWTIIATEDSTYFTDENLQKLSGIIFLHTTGDILGEPGQQALQNYIHKGGGIAGIHAAADCEYNWPWYNQLIGAYFESHPQQQVASLITVAKHPATSMLPESWSRKDEWYNFKNVSPAIKVILKLDENSYTGGKMGDSHPAAWYQDFEGGKVFYTALGHTRESYTEPLFLEHLKAGIITVLR